ncbi:hypothetical protein NE237_014732 [Protea cynaroides]|uniref:Uncharacterized protein n=1 Tax=Protea cynaroides TaxID=273540 RepID=A0A9Q0KCV4_9MAGN|nr:hypothetical protein NE237_014732 [Protea cynaroides]
MYISALADLQNVKGQKKRGRINLTSTYMTDPAAEGSKDCTSLHQIFLTFFQKEGNPPCSVLIPTRRPKSLSQKNEARNPYFPTMSAAWPLILKNKTERKNWRKREGW